MSPLTPLTGGQAPTLGPFGGTTRVTPPEMGAFAAPNNYLGGGASGGAPAPVDSNNLGIGPLGVYAPPTSGVAIGSGVQVAGWNDGSAAPTQSPGAVQTYGNSSSVGLDPRGGGMKVNDLTRAASPPGYRSTPSGFQNPPPTYTPPTNWQPTAPPQNLQPINSPPQAEIARGRLAPLPPTRQGIPVSPITMDPMQPRSAAPPSTEPVAPAGSQQDLLWRQPGTRY